jgi:hypothetical protein
VTAKVCQALRLHQMKEKLAAAVAAKFVERDDYLPEEELENELAFFGAEVGEGTRYRIGLPIGNSNTDTDDDDDDADELPSYDCDLSIRDLTNVRFSNSEGKRPIFKDLNDLPQREYYEVTPEVTEPAVLSHTEVATNSATGNEVWILIQIIYSVC